MQQRDGGGVLWPFEPVCVAATSLARKTETEVVSSLFALPPPPSHATARRRWIFMSFQPHSRPRYLACKSEPGGFSGGLDPVHSTATSPAYNSESDISFMALQPRLHRATSLACNSESEVVCMAFRPHSRCRHLPRMKQQAGP